MGRRKRLKQLTTTWAGRTLTTARMAASVGRAGARKAVEHIRDSENPDADAALGEALVENMDAMKGLMMKLGQMVSYLEGTMPPHAQRALRRLQREAEPLPFETVVAAIEHAFDRDVGEVFEDLSEVPMAAASIGQVHTATVDGREVAVKVQYPGISETLDIDLGNLDKLGIVATVGTKMQARALVAELRDRMAEECDYRQEAANQQAFREIWAHEPRVVIPAVLPEHSTDTVLTTELLAGRGFYDFAENAPQAARDEAGALIFRFAFGSIFGSGCFNGDPHPGNYLFLDDGRVGFLDFGCVRYFDEDFVRAWKTLARVRMEGRREDLPAAARGVGFVPEGVDWDWDHFWEVMAYLYKPFLTPDFVYTHAYVKESYETLFWNNPDWRRTQMPPEWLLANRLQWGLNSVLAILGSRNDWGELYLSCLDQPIRVHPKPAR